MSIEEKVPETKVTEVTKNLDPEIQVRDIKWRAHAKELAEENEKLKATLAKEKSELLSKVESSAKAQQELQKKVMDAEIKAQAISAGIKDLDFIKLLDTSKISIKEDGSIEGLEKALEDLKAAKPILFGAEKKTSSSKGETMPNKEREAKVDAFALSDTEYAAQRAKLGL